LRGSIEILPMRVFDDVAAPQAGSRFRGMGAYALELVVIGALYFALAKAGLSLASINPSATPIWPPSGLALAAVLLRGYRIAPAILLAAFAANATTAGSLATSAAIGAGNMLEGLAGAWLINRWSGGRDTFATPAGVVRFSLISFLPTALSATIGVGSLTLAGFAEWPNFGSIWLTWWLGDLAGALLVTPVIVLWAGNTSFRRQDLIDSLALYAGTCAIGFIAFSPLIEHTAHRAPLAFLAILPLLWSALRASQRDTAAVALILSGFAIWTTLSGGGLFARESINESFLLVLMFVISMAVLSLALSADATVRQQTEEELRRTQEELNQRVEARTTALRATNRALQQEVDHRRRIEVELDQQRLFLEEAQRLANMGSWFRDIEQNRITWSEQLYEIFGIKPGEEFAGTFEGYLKRIHPDDREQVREEVLRSIALGDGFRAERRIVRPSGEVRHIQTCVEMFKNEHGRVVRMHGVCLDVTDRKEAERTLERTREQLAQVQKMEAIGQLTGGIAHDFNNLLMIVSGHAEMLRRRVSEPKAVKGIEAISNAAQRGESLTRQLLTFSRRQPLNPVAIDLRQRVEAMRDMLGSSLRGNITLAVDIPPDLWPVKVDVAELELALVNIAVNARDAMPEGGAFTVSARNVVVPPGRRAGHLAGDHVEVALSDTGTGIPPEVIKKIFDPFFTTKEVGKGTGLGLSQVYGFANQSGGVINVQSQVGRGTTITLYLPRSHAVAAPSPQSANPERAARSEGTVLVVEDNPEVGEVTATLLEQIGYRVLRAENAAEALAQLQSGNAVDLLFSDIVMPNGMNGIHLAQEVSERYPAMRVLLTTGYSDVAAAGETRFQILRKPFEVSALERAIADAMAGTAGPSARRAGGSTQ
jgi:PAS domain S-box-containing protein